MTSDCVTKGICPWNGVCHGHHEITKETCLEVSSGRTPSAADMDKPGRSVLGDLAATSLQGGFTTPAYFRSPPTDSAFLVRQSAAHRAQYRP